MQINIFFLTRSMNIFTSFIFLDKCCDWDHGQRKKNEIVINILFREK